MIFSDKVKRASEVAKLTQQELADNIGVSKRTIAAYESQGAIPRKGTLAKLAAALKVSVKYLSDDSFTDPLADIEQDDYVAEARALYGEKGAKEAVFYGAAKNSNTAGAIQIYIGGTADGNLTKETCLDPDGSINWWTEYEYEAVTN